MAALGLTPRIVMKGKRIPLKCMPKTLRITISD
jgi:hypothetical protein